MRKTLFGFGNKEIGMTTNIVPITLQLVLIGFSPLGILLCLKMSVNLNQYRGTVGTFNNRNYYNKLTLSLGITERNYIEQKVRKGNTSSFTF